MTTCTNCGMAMRERSIITLPFTKQALLDALADLEFVEKTAEDAEKSYHAAKPTPIEYQVPPIAEPKPAGKPLFGA